MCNIFVTVSTVESSRRFDKLCVHTVLFLIFSLKNFGNKMPFSNKLNSHRIS